MPWSFFASVYRCSVFLRNSFARPRRRTGRSSCSTWTRPRHRPTTFGSDKQPVGTVGTVPGKFGDACRFSFAENARSGFFTAGVRSTPQLGRCGGNQLLGQRRRLVELGWPGDDRRFQLRAPLRPAASRSSRANGGRSPVPWCDLVPELPAGQPVDLGEGYSPSSFGNLWFGKWYYWGRVSGTLVRRGPGRVGENEPGRFEGLRTSRRRSTEAARQIEGWKTGDDRHHGRFLERQMPLGPTAKCCGPNFWWRRSRISLAVMSHWSIRRSAEHSLPRESCADAAVARRSSPAGFGHGLVWLQRLGQWYSAVSISSACFVSPQIEFAG